MQGFIIGIIIIAIIAYVIFISRTKKLYRAIEEILSGKSESIVIKQSLEQITNTIQAQFKKTISTGKTTLFEYKFNSFVVVPISQKEVLISLAPSDDEVQAFSKLEDEIINSENNQSNGQNNNEITGIERMKLLAGNMLDDIISTHKHTRIHESYDDFIKVFEDFSSFEQYEEASTVVIQRHKSYYKIIIMKEENSFSAYWEDPTLEEILGVQSDNEEDIDENSEELIKYDNEKTYYRAFHQKDKPEMKRPLPYSGYIRTSRGKLIGNDDEDLDNIEIVVKENLDEISFYRLTSTVEKLHWLEEWSIEEGYPLYSYTRESDKEIEGRITAIILTTKNHIYIKLDRYKEVIEVTKKTDDESINWIEPLLTNIEIGKLVNLMEYEEYSNETLDELIIYASERIITNELPYTVGQLYLDKYNQIQEELEKEIDEIPF